MGGADVDSCTDVLSSAPLLCAHAHLGHGDVVALLLDQGAQVKICIILFQSWTYNLNLQPGIKCKSLVGGAVVLKLPVLHPQVDSQSHDGLTALGFAAAAGHLDIVAMLSQHAAKVDHHRSKGHFIISVILSRFQCVTVFLNIGF